MTFSKLHQLKSDYFSKYDWLDLIIASVAFLFYITILWDISIARSCYLLLALIALYLIVTRKITYELSKLEKLFLWSIAAYFGWILITYFINGMPERGGRWIMNRQLRILLIIPIYLMLRSRPIPVNAWWLMVSCGAIVAGLIGITQVNWAPGWPSGRAAGDVGAILFGGISLCMAFMSLTGIKYFAGKKIAILFLIPVCLGLLAMILSGTRGVWISLPFIILTIFWIFARKYSIQRKILILLTLLLIPVILLQFPVTQSRLKLAVTNINKYIQSENINDLGKHDSVGLRIETWRIMLDTVKENPMFGIGIGGYKAERQRHIESEKVSKYVDQLPHAHNQYLEIAVYSGLIGLALHLCIYILPGIVFYQRIKDHTDRYLPLYTSGLIIILGYLFFGLTDVTLSLKAHIMFFGLSIAILLTYAFKKQPPVES